jgi:hypothetical protein
LICWVRTTLVAGVVTIWPSTRTFP